MSSEFIPYSTQCISDADCDAVVKALKSAFLTQGPLVEELEAAVADYCGAKCAIAVTNATAGLHLALLAGGVGANSLVWTSPITFLSSANVALMVGASVDFVDVDLATGNISVSSLQAKLERAARVGTLPDALIAVHYSGRACDMDSIAKLCRHYGVVLVEDAAHALGGSYDSGTKVGSCAYGSDAVFSLHAVKSITTGEGGIVTTNDVERARIMRRLRSHGVVREPEDWMNDEEYGAWYYEMQSLGWNYRLTDIQSALGLSQLKRLDEFISIRRRLVKRYRAMLSDCPIELPAWSGQSAWHLFPVQVPEAPIGRGVMFERLRAAQIGVNVHYIPVHLQPYYRSLGFHCGDFPESERFYARQLSLPLHPKLTDVAQERVCDVVRSTLSNG